MYLDFTVVWGIFPEDAPRIIREYGTLAMVEQKIIEPQVLSICKNAGSNLTTKEFIEGETREKFQQAVTQSLQVIGRKKGIHFLIALVRGFHPAEDIKATIQARMLAEEEKITLKMEQQRDTVAAALERAKRMVEVAMKDFDAETEAFVREEEEEGRKKADETKAHADRTVAALLKTAEEIKAKTVKILGRADADVIEAMKKAEAKKLELLIAAYGGADQYNLATFAESLPEDIQIEYRYAGLGTLWTEMKTTLAEMAARKILVGSSRQPKGPTRRTTPRDTPPAAPAPR
jgi:regulator of protease activity HflC (stomatin/prohibitin superfamily)